MPLSRVQVAGLILVTPLVTGCNDSPSGSEGDCNARIGWAGAIYRGHNELDPEAPRGERLGSADVLDCDESSVATVQVFAVRGVDSSLAVIAAGDWAGVYVAEGAPPSSWPDVLKGR